VKRAKNSPIGEVECPHKGCTKTCPVFKFRPRTEGHKSVFSNKHYAECPVHGRIGSDGSPVINEYILEHGTIWGANRPAGAPEPGPEKPAKNPAPRPAPARNAPEPKPQNKPAPGRPWWQPLID
jgi:hypothetical protein